MLVPLEYWQHKQQRRLLRDHRVLFLCPPVHVRGTLRESRVKGVMLENLQGCDAMVCGQVQYQFNQADQLVLLCGPVKTTIRRWD